MFVLNGFSKAWAMTGWRLGWMVHPQNLVEPMAVLAECNNTGATVFAQYGGGRGAGGGRGVPGRVQRPLPAQRRAGDGDCSGGIRGSSCCAPEGAFYAFPRIAGVTDSLAFARRVLAEAKVGIAAGYTFGPGNEDHVRLCFAIGTERLDEALRRVIAVLDR